MDNETAKYIIDYFPHLLTFDEKASIKHQYFLENGIDQHKIKIAERVLADNRNELFFNNCPKCGQLARTPKSKQCRKCGYDWHEK